MAAGLAVLVAAGCQLPEPPPGDRPVAADDLFHQARGWRRDHGLPDARERLSEALHRLDASDGLLERRLLRANSDPGFRFADSLAALPRARRGRTGVYLVLGFRQNRGEAAQVLNHVAGWMRDQGWRATVVPLNEWGTPDDHARAIARLLDGELPHIDRAIAVGFSMGAVSWVKWMQDHAPALPAAERRKVRLGVFFAGSFRGAAAARWSVEGRGLAAARMRAMIALEDGGSGEALRALAPIADDPWAGRAIPPLERMIPGFTAVQYVTLPDGRDGLPQRDVRMGLLARSIDRQMPWLGPFDGMVESGAQVLPPEDSTPQWIIRVLGSHGMTLGTYFDGTPLSERHGRSVTTRPLAAVEIVDCLLRALPARLLD